MKHYIIGIALALALATGVAAFAETAQPATDPVPAETEDVMTEDATAEEEKVDDGTALQEALDAYRKAKASRRADELTEELNGYVEAGLMTQAQADLILNSAKERMAAGNGECPNCGYSFRNDAPRMDGQRGLHSGNQRGGWMNGQMPGSRTQPDAQSGALPQQPNGWQSGNQMPGGQQAPQR